LVQPERENCQVRKLTKNILAQGKANALAEKPDEMLRRVNRDKRKGDDRKDAEKRKE
jgi:hypothetical protein